MPAIPAGATVDAPAALRPRPPLDEVLTCLRALAHALGTADVEHGALVTVCRAFRDFTVACVPCHAFTVSLYEPARQERHCVYAWMEDGEIDVRRFPPLPMTGSPNSRAVAAGEIVITDDFMSAIAGQPVVFFRSAVDPRPPRSSIAVPLTVMRRVVGAIHVQSVEPSAYRQEDGALLATAGSFVAVAIERLQLLEREQASRAAAEAAVGVRDQFLDAAAHELKTPLTSLRSMAQLILREVERRGAADPNRLRRAFQLVDHQTERLSRLVNQILGAARVQSGRLVLRQQCVDLRPLVAAAVAAAQTGAAHELRLIQPPAAVLASVDGEQLALVLRNLLDNAVRYSPAGGAVEVSLAIVDRPAGAGGGVAAAEITVRDHGLGIPPPLRPHVFERFFQAHAAVHLSGVGLGLYTSREIARLHGGDLRLEFPDDGGTRAVVSLPAAVFATGEP